MKIDLEEVYNARDLGGIPVAGGGRVSFGRLLRTGRLSEMTEKDREVLFGTCHVTEIVDLRSGKEIAEHPNPEIPGVKGDWNPIHPDHVPGITREDDGETDPTKRQLNLLRGLNGEAKATMAAMYRRMVTAPYSVGQLKKFFDLMLAHGDGAILWHCSAGKDRTGVTAALLLEAMGAGREDIYADYLLTNEMLEERHEETRKRLAAATGDEKIAEQAVILDSVDPYYLDTVYGAIETEWGGVIPFLEGALGVTKEKRELLREKYTEKAHTAQEETCRS